MAGCERLSGGRWVLPREWAIAVFLGALVPLWWEFLFGLGLTQRFVPPARVAEWQTRPV